MTNCGKNFAQKLKGKLSQKNQFARVSNETIGTRTGTCTVPSIIPFPGCLELEDCIFEKNAFPRNRFFKKKFSDLGSIREISFNTKNNNNNQRDLQQQFCIYVRAYKSCQLSKRGTLKIVYQNTNSFIKRNHSSCLLP